MLNRSLIEQLKTVDPDRYRAAVFADRADREALFVIYAFHYELAKVPELVSEPMIGAIRYQWWREALDEVYTGKPVRQHEVTTPLADIIKERDIPRFWMDRLIDGRERDLDPRRFADIDEVKTYCANTSGVLMQIAVKTLGEDADDSVLKAGQAWGLIGLARSWGHYQKGMLSEIEFTALCEAAHEARREASTSIGQMNSRAFPAVAYASLVSGYHSRLTHSKYDPILGSVSYRPVLKKLRLMGSVMTGRI